MRFLKGMLRGFWITCLVIVAVYAWAVHGLGMNSDHVTWAMGCTGVLVLPLCCILMGFGGLSHPKEKSDVAGADGDERVE